MPEDSVRPETQTLVALTRRKEWAGSLEILFLKALNDPKYELLYLYFHFVKNKLHIR